MTFPVEIGAGPFRWPPHLIFELLAYTTAFQLYLWLRRRHGDTIDHGTRWSIVAAAIVGAALGSRMLYWLEDPRATLARWREVEYLFGGKTVVGGLIGGWIGVELTKRALGVTRRTGDLFAVPLAVGIAIGRIGCFLTGLADDTYGTPSSLPWAVDFGDGVLRHPVQLYETLFMLALAWVLARRAWLVTPGTRFKVFMASYMTWRVAIDFLKPMPAPLAGLTAIQWAALAILVYYAQDLRRERVHDRARSR